MQQHLTQPPPDFVRPPGEDDLPYSDGMPMESLLHAMLGPLLAEILWLHFAGKRQMFIAWDMFVYFSPDQVLTKDFRGPDFFVVLDEPQTLRKSWVVWEHDGRTPDIVIEFLSPSTAHIDRTQKKDIYEQSLRVPEYYLFDPESGELSGFALVQGHYLPMQTDEQGRISSDLLGLLLTPWTGVVQGNDGRWLRWATPEGTLLPTREEGQRAAETENESLRRRIAELEARLGGYTGANGASQ